MKGGSVSTWVGVRSRVRGRYWEWTTIILVQLLLPPVPIVESFQLQMKNAHFRLIGILPVTIFIIASIARDIHPDVSVFAKYF